MTSDVLALIDGALDDWATSPDAMRWTSEPVVGVVRLPPWIDEIVAQHATYGQCYMFIPRRSGRHTLPLFSIELPAEPPPRVWLDETQQWVSESLWRAANPALQPFGISREPEPDPARQRALDARRNRNTGPALPRLGHGR